MTARYVRVVSLWVHPGQEAAFEAFEHDAARLMARHGGRIEHAVRVSSPPQQSGGEGRAPLFEIHVVSFPGRAAFESYRAAPETTAMAARRAGIIARTEGFDGESAGPYGV